MDDEIKIRLRGEGVKPGLIRSKEIAEILESIEEIAITEALSKNPKLQRSDIIVGVYAIDDESIGLRFKTTFAAAVVTAFISTAEAIGNNNYDSISPHSLSSLKVISNFSKRHTCDAILGSGEADELAVITPDTEIPSPSYISGETEILGKVIRVGGKTPKAMLELPDGSSLYCEIPESIAKQLAPCVRVVAASSES